MNAPADLPAEAAEPRPGDLDELARRAARILIETPDAGDGCEHGNSLAGAVLALPPGQLPRWRAERAVREARAALDADPALRRSLRAALA